MKFRTSPQHYSFIVLFTQQLSSESSCLRAHEREILVLIFTCFTSFSHTTTRKKNQKWSSKSKNKMQWESEREGERVSGKSFINFKCVLSQRVYRLFSVCLSSSFQACEYTLKRIPRWTFLYVKYTAIYILSLSLSLSLSSL